MNLAPTIAAALLVSIPVLGWSQEADEPEPDREPHFVYLRVGSSSPVYAYYTYTLESPRIAGGDPFLVFGWIHDPWAAEEEEYREWLAGGGLGFAGARGYLLPFVAAAHATDAWYLEPSIVGSASEGRLTLYGFAAAYVPIERAGVWQAYVDPGTITIRMLDRLDAGLAASWFKVEDVPASVGIGVTGQFALPFGSISLDRFWEVQEFQDDWRATLQVVF